MSIATRNEQSDGNLLKTWEEVEIPVPWGKIAGKYSIIQYYYKPIYKISLLSHDYLLIQQRCHFDRNNN